MWTWMSAAVFFLLLNCPFFPSLVFIYCFVNPGGWIPSWLINLLVKVRPPEAGGKRAWQMLTYPVGLLDWRDVQFQASWCSFTKQHGWLTLIRTGVANTQDWGRGKDQNLHPEYQLPTTFPPRSHQHHSLEPLDNNLLLVGTRVPVDPVSAYAGVRPTWLGRQWDMLKPGEASTFIFVFSSYKEKGLQW